ncbi:MAG: metallophosphoesterase [Bacteroidales bacterium]|jgi:predicted MPP superfamily phosphohydrolase|nr:metallophosphoesterase [Bacteroidales bacterium]
MKNSQLLIFFTIVLTIYSSVNIYIFLKGSSSVPAFGRNRAIYLISFLILSFSFIAGKILEARNSTVLSDILNIVGGFWMAFMLYGFIFLIIGDLLSILLRSTGVLNETSFPVWRKWYYISVLILSIVLIAAGFINALVPRIQRYEISIAKSAGEIREMKIAAVSDIHLGSIIRKRSIKQLSEMLKSLEPDIVLLLGDIVDGEIGPVLRDDLLQYFHCPACRAGLWAITGNHEFIGGAQQTIPYIESKGIRLLNDTIVTLEGGIQLVGRLDRDSRRFYGKERKKLSEIMSSADLSKPVILLDHQPFDLDEARKNGVDLQLSGHTHNGQMWPLNLLTRKIYELSHGYMKKGDTHYIVSSGFGVWGPRVRLGSRPEVLLVTVKFGNQP